jgi:hypothetical protein
VLGALLFFPPPPPIPVAPCSPPSNATSHYTGNSLVTAFQPHGAHIFSFFAKLVFTVITLSSGFKGGEVTPLFYIGATLGNSVARMLYIGDDRVNMFASMGFVAVFSGATNTPIACFIMGVELFGGRSALYMGTACVFGYMFSATHGIYTKQRVVAGTKVGGSCTRPPSPHHHPHLHPHSTPQPSVNLAVSPVCVCAGLWGATGAQVALDKITVGVRELSRTFSQMGMESPRGIPKGLDLSGRGTSTRLPSVPERRAPQSQGTVPV